MIRRLNVGAIPNVKSVVAELLAKLFTIINVVIPIRCEVQVFDCTFENDEIQVAFAGQAEEIFLAWRTDQVLMLLALDRSGLRPLPSETGSVSRARMGEPGCSVGSPRPRCHD